MEVIECLTDSFKHLEKGAIYSGNYQLPGIESPYTVFDAAKDYPNDFKILNNTKPGKSMKQQINHPNENTLEDQARQLLNDLEIDAGRQMTAGNLTELTELIAERNLLNNQYCRIRAERDKLKNFIIRERYAAGIAENIALTCNDPAKARQHKARRAQCLDILEFIEFELNEII